MQLKTQKINSYMKFDINCEYDNIYKMIVKRIVEKKGESNKYMPSRCIRYKRLTPLDINDCEKLISIQSDKSEEMKMWSELYGNISPDTYAARIILYCTTKRPISVFVTKNDSRMDHFVSSLKNVFMSNTVREEFIHHFCKFKRTYWGFKKLARIWKIRRIPIRIQCDLYMNELDSSNPNTYTLIHPNGIYLFSLQNLNRIILDAITYRSGLFVEPLPIKNPYTNDLLTKGDLFNIYFASRNANMRVHEMFERFFQSEFDVFKFKMIYETELRDYAIVQYAKTGSANDLAQDVDDMLRIHNMTKRINIGIGFPYKKLVETMRPFLKLYLLERYSFSSITRKYSALKLKMRLNQFADTNPIYGRRITIGCIPSPMMLNLIPAKLETTFITDVTRRRDIYEKLNYMKTHIYEETKFNRYVETGNIVYTPNSFNVQQSMQQPDDYNEWDDDDDDDEPAPTTNNVGPAPTVPPPPQNLPFQTILNHFSNSSPPPIPPSNTPNVNNTVVNMDMEEEENTNQTVIEDDEDEEEEEDNTNQTVIEDDEDEDEAYWSEYDDGYDSVS
jgi:hypothetical protein